MPAIQIERLKLQIQSILNPQLTPEDFIISMRSFMEAHANLAFHVSAGSQQNRQMERYELARVITNQLHLSISQFSKSYPETALHFADVLWIEPFFEMKELAGVILGALPENMAPLVLQKIILWNEDNKDKAIRKIIFNTSTQTIRQGKLSEWQNIIKHWLDSGQPANILTALFAMQILIQDAKFENFPFIFNSLKNISIAKNEKINNAWFDVLQTAAILNPLETSAFVKNLIQNHPSDELFRLVRRSLPVFPEAQQTLIRQAMKTWTYDK